MGIWYSEEIFEGSLEAVMFPCCKNTTVKWYICEIMEKKEAASYLFDYPQYIFTLIINLVSIAEYSVNT